MPFMNLFLTRYRVSSLRTLEFWVDNINIDFLYPILSQDSSLLAELMKSLASHLQPAHYQFGLLTLRLLGKLGGKNRSFLQDPVDFEHSAFSDAYPETAGCKILRIRFGELEYPLPINLAVSILKSIPANQRRSKELSPSHANLNDEGSFKKFCHEVHLESFDLDAYNSDVSLEVIKTLVISAFDVLRSGISTIVYIHSSAIEDVTDLSTPGNLSEMYFHTVIERSHVNKELFLLLEGLF
jgi:transformation/transcription domain-associated protein